MATSNDEQKRRVLIGCSGSVASVKIPLLIQSLKQLDFPVEMKVVATESSLHFFDHSSVDAEVYRDADEWTTWQKMGDPVLHIELRRWAEIMVISPTDANTLAKIANGLCDNLLTCVVRAWDFKKQLLFAPAMNTAMYDHPITLQHINTLQTFGFKLIPPIVKTLACAEKGNGAMAEVVTIVEEIKAALGSEKR